MAERSLFEEILEMEKACDQVIIKAFSRPKAKAPLPAQGRKFSRKHSGLRPDIPVEVVVLPVQIQLIVRFVVAASKSRPGRGKRR